MAGLPAVSRIGLRQKAGRLDEVLQLYARALAIAEKVHGRDSSALTMTLYQMARLRHQRGEPAACEALLRRVLAIHADDPDAAHGLAMPQIELARCLTALGRFDEAEAFLRPLTADGQIGPVKDRAREALAELERARGGR